MTYPRIAVTAGEPAGIGPDLCIQLAQHILPCQWVVIADPELLQQRAQQLKQPLVIEPFVADAMPSISQPGHLCVLPVSMPHPAIPGQLDPRNSRYVLQTLTLASQGCRDGLFAGMVTAPVHKGIINDAGIAFTGHTEFIADLCGGNPVMMLATPGLRVALVTTHLPLTQVSSAITSERLELVIRTLHADLRQQFAIADPNILVCGLNPHAGENGHLGNEEILIISPTLQKLRSEGIRLQGPLPADTVFTPRYLQQGDVVLAMYHDQGLPVLKHMGFGNAVNITLGLPIIRTSVDHGTALDLAGSGKADAGSLQFALETALSLIRSNSLH